MKLKNIKIKKSPQMGSVSTNAVCTSFTGANVLSSAHLL